MKNRSHFPTSAVDSPNGVSSPIPGKYYRSGLYSLKTIWKRLSRQKEETTDASPLFKQSMNLLQWRWIIDLKQTALLTPLSKVLPQNLIYIQLLKKFPTFIVTENLLSRSQEPATGPYPVPHESNPHTLTTHSAPISAFISFRYGFAAVGSRRLTAWTTTRPKHSLSLATQSVGLPGRGISRRKAATYTWQHKHKINAHRHPSLEWDSNPRSQCSSGRKPFMP
jgi:hypothetical protein